MEWKSIPKRKISNRKRPASTLHNTRIVFAAAVDTIESMNGIYWRWLSRFYGFCSSYLFAILWCFENDNTGRFNIPAAWAVSHHTSPRRLVFLFPAELLVFKTRFIVTKYGRKNKFWFCITKLFCITVLHWLNPCCLFVNLLDA